LPLPFPSCSQTAVNFEAGRPVEGSNVGKQFDIGDLWDVLRLASAPSRAVIRDSWVKSLTYSISTSPNGTNMMTSICHLAKIEVNSLFAKMPSSSLSDIMAENGADVQVISKYMSGEGAKTEDLVKLQENMFKNRRLRCKFKRLASVSNVSNMSPYDSIKEVLHGMSFEEIRDYTTALFPTLLEAGMHYNTNHVLRWANGLEVEAVENPLPGRLKYMKVPANGGGAQQYNNAWVVVKDIESDVVKFNPVVTDLRSGVNGTTPLNLFDIHDAGAVDTLMLLETNEASRLCVEMPRGPREHNPMIAFEDDAKSFPNKDSKKIYVRDVKEGDKRYKASEGTELTDIRRRGSGTSYGEAPVLKYIDLMTNRGRLPALQPYTSTRYSMIPPIRRVEHVGVVVNIGVAHEHVNMVIESSLRCTQIDGLRGHQEVFKDDSKAVFEGFASRNLNGNPIADHGDDITTVLPFSNDIVQIGWAIDISSRQYIDNLTSEIEYFNDAVRESGQLGDPIKEEDMPQQHLACMGYPISLNKSQQAQQANKDHKLLQLLSLKVNKKAKFENIEVADSSVSEDMQVELLKNEVGMALGRAPTSGEIESYRMDRVGENFMWGVTGDLNAYSTWCNHASASMIGKGNAYPSPDPDDPTQMDPAVTNKYDTELMLQCRMLERMAQIKDTPEYAYNIQCAWPQTYSALIKKANAAIQKQAEVAARSKRARQATIVESRAKKNPYKTSVPKQQEGAAASSSSSSGAGPSDFSLTMTDVRDA